MIIGFFQYLELIALLAAIICYNGLQRYRLTVFVPILIIVNIVEFTGMNFRSFGWKDNYFIYNWYLLLTTPLYLFAYGIMLNLQGRAKKIYFIFCLAFMLLLLLNYFFVQGKDRFNSYNMIAIAIMYIVLSCLVLFNMSLASSVAVNLLKEPYFWISAANLLFSISTLVLLGMQDYIKTNRINIGKTSLYHAILPAVNVGLYAGFAYAFILSKRRKDK